MRFTMKLMMKLMMRLMMKLGRWSFSAEAIGPTSTY